MSALCTSAASTSEGQPHFERLSRTIQYWLIQVYRRTPQAAGAPDPNARGFVVGQTFTLSWQDEQSWRALTALRSMDARLPCCICIEPCGPALIPHLLSSQTSYFSLNSSDHVFSTTPSPFSPPAQYPPLLTLRIAKPSVPNPPIINECTPRPRISSLLRFLPSIEIRAASVEVVDVGGDDAVEEEAAGD